jgi:hypothetical protein
MSEEEEEKATKAKADANRPAAAFRGTGGNFSNFGLFFIKIGSKKFLTSSLVYKSSSERFNRAQ